MIWEDMIKAVSTMLTGVDTNTTIAGIFVSTIITVGVILAIVASTREHSMLPSGIGTFLCIAMFTMFGWYPIWLGIIGCLAIAVGIGMLAKQSTQGMS